MPPPPAEAESDYRLSPFASISMVNPTSRNNLAIAERSFTFARIREIREGFVIENIIVSVAGILEQLADRDGSAPNVDPESLDIAEIRPTTVTGRSHFKRLAHGSSPAYFHGHGS